MQGIRTGYQDRAQTHSRLGHSLEGILQHEGGGVEKIRRVGSGPRGSDGAVCRPSAFWVFYSIPSITKAGATGRLFPSQSELARGTEKRTSVKADWVGRCGTVFVSHLRGKIHVHRDVIS